MSSSQWPSSPGGAGGGSFGPSPDPSGSGTSPVPFPSPGPAGSGPAPFSGPGQSSVGGGGPSTAAPPPTGPRGRGTGLKILLGVLAVVVILALAAAGLVVAGVLPDPRRGTVTPTVPATTTLPPALRYLSHAEVQECKKDERVPFLPNFNVAIRITNREQDTASYVVTTELVDGNGTRVDELVHKATRLAAGQATTVSTTMLRDLPVGSTCKVLKVERTPE